MIELGPRPVVGRNRTGQRYPVSLFQEYVVREDQRIRASGTLPVPNNVQLAYELHGALDVAALRLGLQAVIERHEPLRTHFPAPGPDGNVFAVVKPAATVAPRLTPELAFGQHEPAHMDSFLLSEWRQCFNIARGPLVAARLWRFGPAHHLLVITLDHLVCDGTASLRMMARDLFSHYARQVDGAEESGPEVPLPFAYSDFSVAHREWLDGGARTEIENYWRRQLPATAPEPVLALPTDGGRTSTATGPGSIHRVAIPEGMREQLKQTCMRFRTTPFVAFLTAILAAVRGLGGGDVVGAMFPVNVRAAFRALDHVGRFSDISALHVRATDAVSYQDLLCEIRERVLAAQQAAGLPFGEVVRALYPEAYQRVTYPPCLFVTNDHPDLPEFSAAGLVARPRYAPLAGKECIHPGLSVRLTDRPGDLAAVVHYPVDAYPAPLIERLAARIRSGLAQLLVDPASKIAARA